MSDRRGKRPLVVAHRGSSGTAPENTMAAFRLALEAGADMIELDVRMTRDMEPVVHHDRRLGRTTAGRGRIRDLLLDDLRHVDAGSWYGKKFSGERIPTLHQVLAWLPASAGLNIEVKTDGDRRRGIPECIVRAVRRSGKEDAVVVSSFDHGLLRRVRRLDARLRLGALFLPVRDGLRRASVIAGRAGAGVFVCSRRQLRERHVRDAHAAGMSVAVYGVNSASDLSSALNGGADAVITDYPARILRALGSL